MGYSFESRPLTPRTWADLEALFDLPGGSIVRGCWCMYYRKSGKVLVNSQAGADNKKQLCELVDNGVVPGLVGHVDGVPAGWISLGPREDYPKLQRSRIMKPVDDSRVWSVVCTYVARRHRGQGVQHRLLDAAVRYARERGVRILEAYPVDKPERSHDDFMFFGSRSLYERAGFTEVIRRSPTRVIMRRKLSPASTQQRSTPLCASFGLLDVSIVGRQAVRFGVWLVDAEGDDPLRMEPDERAALGGECLCHAADLDTSHAPRLD